MSTSIAGSGSRLAIVCVAYLAVSAVHLRAPLLRHREGALAYYAILARNQVWHGYGKLRLGLVETASPDLNVYGDWTAYYYPNRPVVSVVGMSLWFRIFGDSEASARLNLTLIGLLTILAFAGVARRIAPDTAEIATVLFAFLPIFCWFSRAIPHLAYCLLLSLVAWYANLRWDEGRRFRILMFAALFLACHSDWPGYFAVLSIAVHRFRGWRCPRTYLILASALAFFGLHLLHLLWLAPDGRLISTFFQAGLARSPHERLSLVGYLGGEAREVGLYFTIGACLLAAFGAVDAARRRAGALFCLAILGLEEILFAKLAHEHDYLTYSLAPFAALAAARGLGWLWSRRRAGRVAAMLLVGLAAAQSAWILWDRSTRFGATEVQWRVGTAIREATSPRDRILLTLPDIKQFTPYYAQRYVASREPGIPDLMIHPSGPRIPMPDLDALCRHLEADPRGYDLVVAGDPEGARREIAFLAGAPADLLDRFGFYPEDHPLRRTLDRLAARKETRGAFVFYWMR